MKAVLLMAGVALLTFAAPAANPAHASWAESANMENPVYTGTDRSLAKARRGLDRSTTARGRYYYYYPRGYYYRPWW